jgi:CDP-diacylglycerol---serine O-phosphatidyltransferase
VNRRPNTSLADLMTIGNGVCGFLALVVLADLWVASGGGPLDEDKLRVCLLLYGLGMVLDVLDGAVARRFGSSGLGSTLDTICDAISFGLLPGMLLVASLHGETGWKGATLLAASLYVAGTILRLARFAHHEAEEEAAGAQHAPGPFSGMPAPAGGNCVLALVVLAPPAPVAAFGVLAVAYLLVADFPYPDKSRWGGVYVAALLAASFVALAGLMPLEVPAAAALIGLLPVAVVRVTGAWMRALRPVAAPTGRDAHAHR